MADTKTPTHRSDVTLADVPGPVPDPMPPVAPRPGFPLGLRDLLVSIFTDGPTWAKIVVAVALILAGALGHKCAERAPAPVNLQPAPVNLTVQPPSPVAYKLVKDEGWAKIYEECREGQACCPTVCACDPEQCKCPGCKECHGPRPPTAQVRPRDRLVHPGHAFLNDRMRERLVERLQDSGYATVGGNANPFTEEQSRQAVAKLTDEQVDRAGRMVGAWMGVGDGGGLLGWIKAALLWVRDHPEEVERWLRFLLTILMFV